MEIIKIIVKDEGKPHNYSQLFSLFPKVIMTKIENNEKSRRLVPANFSVPSSLPTTGSLPTTFLIISLGPMKYLGVVMGLLLSISNYCNYFNYSPWVFFLIILNYFNYFSILPLITCSASLRAPIS